MTTPTLPTIAQVVPHAGAMRLLDTLLHADDEHAVAQSIARQDNLFAGDGGIPAWVGIEFMAQTIAAWAGARALRAGGAPAIGFLLGSRRYESDVASFPFGAVLTMTARMELIGDNGLGMFACTLALDGREVARANVSVYQPADPWAFLEGNPS